MEVIRIERDGELAVVVLNRPDSLNALSNALCDALVRAFRELADDPGIRAVILTGEGRAFSAGVDLKELSNPDRKRAEFDADEMIGAVRNFPGPVIAAVNGFAITGGFELALGCDLIVASSEARFADTHARVGLLPGWGLSQKLPRLIGMGRAKELAFTGNYLDAEQAEAWGLANRVTAPEALLPTCRALAKDMLSCQPDALRDYKQLIDEGFDMNYGDAIRHEAAVSRGSQNAIRSEDVAERRAGIQRRGRDQAGG
ncbi:MAG: enoyl-CoA hydratase [Myxococcota bacterium]|nr:enoyl-CoA hydratase [Myxococcota bacterium]